MSLGSTRHGWQAKMRKGGVKFGAGSLRLRAQSNTAGKGIALSSSNTAAVRFYADDGGAAATGNLRGLLTRTLASITHTGGVSLRSITGQLKVNDGIDFSSENSVVAGVFGYLEFAGASTLAGQVAAGEFTIEAADDLTVSSNGVLAGVASRLNMASGKTITETGEAAAFVVDVTGVAADKWPKGVYIPADSADVGIKCGAQSNTAGSGLDMSEVATTNMFYADDGGDGSITGDRRNVLARTLLSIDNSGTASFRSVVGQMKIGTGVDHSGAGVIAGVMGYLEFAGISTMGGQVAAGEFTIEGADNITNNGEMYGVASRLLMAGGKAISGRNAAYFAGTTGAAGDTWNAAVHIDGADNVFSFESATAYEDGIKTSANTPGGNTTHAIRVDIGGTPGYIPVYAAETF